MKQHLYLTKLDNPLLVSEASKFTPRGYLAVTPENLTYLNITDDYIHQLFPLLKDTGIQKPGYFNLHGVGAHVSVIYPEENTSIRQGDLGQEHEFEIQGAYEAILGGKKYNVITVASPSLTTLRRRYDLPKMLCFKGHLIDFHITIGVCG